MLDLEDVLLEFESTEIGSDAKYADDQAFNDVGVSEADAVDATEEIGDDSDVQEAFQNLMESESTQIGCDDNYADNELFNDVRKKSGYSGLGKKDYYADDQEMNDVGISEGYIDLTDID